MSAKVFINYRRKGDASRPVALRMYDRLCHDLGKESVFIDVDRIPPGCDFVEYLEEQIEKCDWVLALIGRAWLDPRKKPGKRRLDNPKDWVRIELAAALRRRIRVVPVLVDGGKLPDEDALPEELKALPRRQAVILTDTGFHHELDRLVAEIKNEPEGAKPAATKQAEEPPKHSEAGPRIIVSPKSGIELVRIEGGTFLMGAPESEGGSEANERPQHRVTVSPFLLGRFPVTNEQYGRYLAANPGVAKPKYWEDSRYNQPRQPVVGVSWNDAVKYANWAGLRLPTEAEWEYACRAGSQGRFCSGEKDADLDKVGWHDGSSGGRLHAVGELAPNAWGLHDMHGNVFEWCSDWGGEYAAPDQVDPTGPALGRGRVVRGGSWGFWARLCRSAYRYGRRPDERFRNLGFRLASGQ